MKKNFVLRLAEFGLSLLATTTLSAQSLNKADLNPTNGFSAVATTAATKDLNTLEDIKGVSEKTFVNFSKSFRNAEKISYTVANNRMVITFMLDGDRHMVLYSKRGSWLQTIRSFENEKLSDKVRELVNDGYPRYEIFGIVNEVKIGPDTALLIRIEDKKSWKILRLMKDELDVYESYTKQ